MSQPEIPEYYRHLANSPGKPENVPEDVGDEEGFPPTGESGETSSERLFRGPSGTDKAGLGNLYTAQSFEVDLPEGWRDRTTFTLVGPVEDGVLHNITITREADVQAESLQEFAELQVRSLEESLHGCRLLLKEPINLHNGLSAYRAIFVWWPLEDVRLYQEQLYVLYADTGFTLTASFSKKTRRTLGPEIERAMLSFSPTD